MTRTTPPKTPDAAAPDSPQEAAREAAPVPATRLSALRERIAASEAGRRGATSKRFSATGDSAAAAGAERSVPQAPAQAAATGDGPEEFEILLTEALTQPAPPSGLGAARVGPLLAAGFAVAALFASAGFTIGMMTEGLGASAAAARFAGPAMIEPVRAAPSPALVAEARSYETIETASIPKAPVSLPHDPVVALQNPEIRPGEGPYLSGATLRQLLRDRPLKCVVAAPLSAGGDGPIDGEALRLAASISGDCVETVVYDPAAALLVREAPAPGGGRIEINAAFSVEADAVCHQTRGLSALVIGGEMTAERARSLETLLDASYASLRGSPICHRLQPLGEGPDGPVFRADAFIDGNRVASRSDPRPFVMKRRETVIGARAPRGR